MEAKRTGIEVYIMTMIGGLAIASFGGMNILGYGIMTLGGITSVGELVKTFNPYKKLFENLNLKVGDKIPRYIKKRKTSYGYCLTFSLPYGMSTKDFEKNKLSIEQYLNKRIEIAYDNYRVFIKVFETNLATKDYAFIPTKNTLEFPIGQTYGNRTITLDLEKVVHLLIAGETGGGKSTLLRVILTNLILRNKRSLSLYLIDLKGGVEFNVFRKSKIVKSFSRSIGEAEIILTDLLQEVERRYELFYENDVVDIREYNKLKKGKLDYKVLVVDEFADLQNEKGSISIIETLTAKSRACGIHLIISTQRPDAKILNGRIKANVPCVLGLKTLNSLNSRIVIDENGLEKLNGKGHGLLKYGETTEFQGMFLSNENSRELIKDTYIEKKIKAKVKEEIKDFGFLEMIK